MKKVFLIVFAIALTVIGGIIFWQPQESGGEPPSITQEPMYYIEQLQKHQQDESSQGEAGLLDLAKNEGALGYKANLALAERLREQGQDPTPYYIKALELYNTNKVRYELASSLEELGQKEETIAQYMKLLPEQNAIDRLLEIEVDLLLVGQALIEGSHWQRVVNLLEEKIELVHDEQRKLALEKQYARALGELGQFSKALAILERIKNNTQLDTELQWWYARSLEATGNTTKAIESYRALGQRGAYRLGIILNNQEKLEESAIAFSQSHQPISLWRGARIWDDLGQKEKALESYLALTRESGIYQDDAAYRVYILSTDQGVKKEMLKILSPYPAWMNRLGEETVWEVSESVKYEKPTFIKMTEIYQELGQEEMAKIELAIGEGKASYEEMLALGDWYLEKDEYFNSVRWGIRARNIQKTMETYLLDHPRAFEEYVNQYAKEFNVDPYLIWAVMREESHFRPGVYSVAGARGLMQIMPATGQDIANKLKGAYKEEDLLNPEVNIRFGAFYIKSMLNMFDGDVEKALAAYNGGSGNVRRWSGTELGSTQEGFTTAISFLETRNYVTKVLNTYYTYKWLYEDR